MSETDAIQKKWFAFLQQARDNEAAVGELYRRYTELFPEQAETWAALACAEGSHVKMLQELIDKGIEDASRIPLGKMNNKGMDFITQQIAVMQENATAGTVTRGRAVTNALLAEAMMEDFLFKAAPLGSEFSIVAKLLVKESHDHWLVVDQLRKVLGNATEDEIPVPTPQIPK